jgi:hypothetical protein
MKLFTRLLLLFMLAGLAPAFAQQQVVNVGTGVNTGDGDIARVAFQKLNANDANLFAFLWAPIFGDVTTVSGSNNVTIVPNAVTLAKMAQMPSMSFICNGLSLQATGQYCTAAQAAAILQPFITGGGGTTGGLSSFSFVTPSWMTISPAVVNTAGQAITISTPTLGADQFLASPCGANGVLSPRTLCAADLPPYSGDIVTTNGVAKIQPGVVTIAEMVNAPAQATICNPANVLGVLQYCTPQQMQILIGATGGGSSSASNLTGIYDECTSSGIDKTGVNDSTVALNRDIQAYAGTSIAIFINCPIKHTVGINPAAPIFVHSNTNFIFGPAGVISTDNNLIPSFVFLNTAHVHFYNANFLYTGGLALNNSVAPYLGVNGAFNDTQEKAELVSQGYSFTNGGSNLYNGPTNGAALIRIQGASHDISFFNSRFYVPDTANATQFIGVVVGLDPEWKCCAVNTNGGAASTWTSANTNAPYDVNFVDSTFDGFLMGFTGTGASVNIINQKFLRYSDLQDASYLTNGTGGCQGGGCNTGAGLYWLAPPHAAYLQAGDASLKANRQIHGYRDYGPYVGGSVRRTASGSGTILSLKLDYVQGTDVTDVEIYRPDGCFDVINNFPGPNQRNGGIKDAVCYYDSSTKTTDNSNVWAMRFPSNGQYTFLAFDNITIYDTAATPTSFPIIGNGFSTNSDISFRNLRVYQNDWFNWNPGFRMGGTNINVQAEYHYAQTSGNGAYFSPVFEQGTDGCDSCNFDITLFGWRQVPVTFTTSPAAGATSVVLSSSWQLASGTATLFLSDGETRTVAVTNGSTAVGSFAALSGAVSNSATAGNLLADNFSGYKPGILLTQGSAFTASPSTSPSQNSRAHILDVSNGYEATDDNGTLAETWSQLWVGNVSGASTTTSISCPSTMSLDRRSVRVLAAITGATSFNVGWTGALTGLYSGIGISTGTNPVTPANQSTLLPNNPTTLVLTPVGGNFTGGTVQVAARCGDYVGN